MVVAACREECANNLSISVQLWFDDMGSQEIFNVQYRQGFAFIGCMGQGWAPANEKRALKLDEKISVCGVFRVSDQCQAEEAGIVEAEEKAFEDAGQEFLEAALDYTEEVEQLRINKGRTAKIEKVELEME